MKYQLYTGTFRGALRTTLISHDDEDFSKGPDYFMPPATTDIEDHGTIEIIAPGLDEGMIPTVLVGD